MLSAALQVLLALLTASNAPSVIDTWIRGAALVVVIVVVVVAVARPGVSRLARAGWASHPRGRCVRSV